MRWCHVLSALAALHSQDQSDLPGPHPSTRNPSKKAPLPNARERLPPFWSIFNHYFFKVLSKLERRVSFSAPILKLRGGRRVTGCPVKHFSKAFLSLTVATLAERSEGQPKNKSVCQVYSKSASLRIAKSRNLAEKIYCVTVNKVEKQSCRRGVYTVDMLCMFCVWSLVCPTGRTFHHRHGGGTTFPIWPWNVWTTS